MTVTLASGLTLAAAVGAGLIGGLFFTFSNFVMAALGRIPPEQGIAAMQAINVTVLNPLFRFIFVATGVVCLALAAMMMFRLQHPGAMFVLAGSVLYLAGSIGVTLLANVPLNDALAALDVHAPEAPDAWRRYQDVWTMWNHVRTVACTASMIALVVGLRWPAL